MKVKCLHANIGEVPELIEKYGYYAQQKTHITRGREYTVYGMISFAIGRSLPSLSYIIRDDCDHGVLDNISTYPAMLFEVTDSRLADVEWHFSFNKNGMDFILGYDDFVNNREHYERAIERDEPDRSRLVEWCNMIDKIQAEEDKRK